MSYHLDDTIVALATAPQGAMRAIIRIAGPAVEACLDPCISHADDDGVRFDQVAKPSVIAGHFRLPDGDRMLPCDVYLWPDQRSYTRTPLAEIHTIGSPPLMEVALRILCQHGARLAEPGEFTLRAFLGGRIDLTQAEAVLGVIDSRGDQQLKVALRQMAGGLSGPLNELRDQMLNLLAHLEAGLDFVEEDIEFISNDDLLEQLRGAHDLIEQLTNQMNSRSDTSHATRAVLIGAANAGKSSLFNALAPESRAIVSESPGTTRDYLTARIELDSTHIELIDTAGIEDTAQATIAEAAQRATTEQRQSAQIRVLCIDSTGDVEAQLSALITATDDSAIIALTKCDQAPIGQSNITLRAACGCPVVRTSSKNGEGVNELRAALRRLAVESDAGDTQVVATTSTRCRESLTRAATYLKAAISAAQMAVGEELVAAEIRSALDEIGQVVGAVYTDDILDRVFSRFCIGK
jgi:tRNA modification GTPase